MDLSFPGWATVAVCAMMVGMSKTGIPGLGILVVPLMALVLPSRQSTGILLGILILGDLFAIIYHRHNAKWPHVFRLLPPAVAGIIVGYFGLKFVSDKQLKPIIGAIVLLMLGLNYWRTKDRDANIPSPGWLAVWLGFMAGITTMMANAAGPVMIIYLLTMRLPKTKFVGTAAWFFFAVNWLKVPFSASLDLMMLPFIAAGAFIGIFFLKRIPQKAFTTVVQILAVAAALKLLF